MTGLGPDREELEAARNYTRQIFGSAMAAKASDSFCVAAAQRQLFWAPTAWPFPTTELTGLNPRFGRYAGALGEAPFGHSVIGRLGRPPMPAIVEFDPPKSSAAAASTRQRHTEAVAPANRSRAAIVHESRTANYQAMSAVYAEIERLSNSAVGVAPEMTGVPQIQSLVTQVCWLNRTVRTWAGPEALANVVGDDSVTGIDLPRPLIAEASLPNHKSIGLPKFSAATHLTGQGITVGVIDSEIALLHPSLAGRVTHRRNYTPEPWGNPDAHGTAVAGIIASRDPDVPGIAPDVDIYNYKVIATNPFLNSDDFSGALAIQQALEDGVGVVNCSWGVGPVGEIKSREARAVDAAWALGLVVVKSAGNNGPGRATVTTPADADGVIVVGATDLAGKKVEPYSSRGPAGANARPHLVAPGGGDEGQLTCALVSGGFGHVGAGTSFAAPHVTGAVALLLQQDTSRTPDQVRKILQSTARKLGNVVVNTQGKGLLQLLSK